MRGINHTLDSVIDAVDMAKAYLQPFRSTELLFIWFVNARKRGVASRNVLESILGSELEHVNGPRNVLH